MADDVLDIILKVGGDFQLLRDLIENPHKVNLDAVIRDQSKITAQAAGLAQGSTAPNAQTQAYKQQAQYLQDIVKLNDKIINQQKQINEQSKFFSTSRIDKGAVREIAFATLFGQGVAGKAAGLVGGVVGAGTGLGAGAGAAIAQSAVQGFQAAFDKIAEGLNKVATAGLNFERSLLGIQSVLQATTEVRGSQGQELSLNQQLGAQAGQAKSIQRAARSKLLPLGISGEKEATLIQAIISGAAQRGIQLNPDQAATLAERLGGAIQAQRPEILENPTLLRRDIEDALSGTAAGKRSIVGSIIRGFAPGVFTANSGEELIDKSKGLSSFPQSLKGSSNPIVVLNQLDAALDNLATTVGNDLVQTLIPAIKSFTEVLTDPALASGLTNLVHGLGSFVSGTIDLTEELALRAGIGAKNLAFNGLNPSGEGLSDDELAISNLFSQSRGKEALELYNFHKKGDIEDRKRQQARKDKLQQDFEGYTNDQDFSFSDRPEAIYSKLEKVLGDFSEYGSNDSNNPFAVIQAASTLSEQIPNLLNDKKTDLGDLSKRIFNAKNLKLGAQQSLLQQGQKLFGGDIYSQISGNLFEQEGLKNVISSREGLVSDAKDQSELARQKREEAEQSYTSAKPGDDLRSLGNALASARDQFNKASKVELDQTSELIKAQNELAASTQRLISLIQQETQFKLQQVNLNTQPGKDLGLNVEQTGLDSETAKLVSRIQEILSTGKGSSEELQSLQGQLTANGVRQDQLSSKEQVRPGERAGVQIDTVKALDDLQNSAFEAAKATQEMATAVYNANQALIDFDRETKLRNLERTDAEAGAKERYADALDKVYGKGTGDAFREDPTQKDLRGLDIAKENFGILHEKNSAFGEFATQDKNTRSGLEFGAKQAEINQTELPYNLASNKLGDIQRIIQLAQQYPDNAQLKDAAQAAQAQLPDVINQLGLGTAGQSPNSLFGKFAVGTTGFEQSFTGNQAANSANYVSGGQNLGDSIRQAINSADFNVNEAVININGARFNSSTYNNGDQPFQYPKGEDLFGNPTATNSFPGSKNNGIITANLQAETPMFDYGGGNHGSVDLASSATQDITADNEDLTDLLSQANKLGFFGKTGKGEEIFPTRLGNKQITADQSGYQGYGNDGLNRLFDIPKGYTLDASGGGSGAINFLDRQSGDYQDVSPFKLLDIKNSLLGTGAGADLSLPYSILGMQVDPSNGESPSGIPYSLNYLKQLKERKNNAADLFNALGPTGSSTSTEVLKSLQAPLGAPYDFNPEDETLMHKYADAKSIDDLGYDLQNPAALATNTLLGHRGTRQGEGTDPNFWDETGLEKARDRFSFMGQPILPPGTNPPDIDSINLGPGEGSGLGSAYDIQKDLVNQNADRFPELAKFVNSPANVNTSVSPERMKQLQQIDTDYVNRKKNEQEQQSTDEFKKQVSGGTSSTNTDIVNTLKQLPAQFGLQVRYALDNSFSGS